MLTAVLVPAGMGYATAAALPAVAGLYATMAALVAYALVGPSRVLVLGPDSSLTPLIAAAVIPLAAGSAHEPRRMALAGLLALLVGAVLVAGGLARLGFVADLLSKPIRLGYLNGIVLVVVVGQLPSLLGFSVDRGGLIDELRDVVAGARGGQVVPSAATIGVGSLAVILFLRHVAPRFPGLLVTVAAAAAVVWGLGLAGVPVVGALPSGLPDLGWGTLEPGDVARLAAPALGVALVAFADTGVLSRALAGMGGTRTDANHEMAALGAANLACGLVGGFPVSASASRTPVARASGATTQITGLVGAAAVALVVVLVPGITRYLPSSALAAVVIAAVVSIVDVPGMVRLARVDRRESALALLAFTGVAVLGVLRGIGAAVALSLALFVARAWHPHTAELVRIDGRKGYHDRCRHPEGRAIPGLVILRFDAPLFFANGELFADFVRRAVSRAPAPARWAIIAAEPITGVDTTAADALRRLDDDLAAQGIRLVFAGLRGPVKDRFVRYGLASRFPPDDLYPTLGTAVSDYVETAGVRWTDWTDRPATADGPKASGGGTGTGARS
jgi:high affinity sulfate transporter 1